MHLDVLAAEARGETLGELLGLLVVGDSESVEEAGAADLELGVGGALADLDDLGVRAAGLLEEIPDVGNLARHIERTEAKGGRVSRVQ